MENISMEIGSVDLPKRSLAGSEIEKEVVVERSGGSNMKKKGAEKKKLLSMYSPRMQCEETSTKISKRRRSCGDNI
ncbi:hypothetical protein HS088_TW06G00589 [Tripterygium wilfordii]|uniref:Uncharacterized protein n=1 Tax=Tripterygium wilfordii TaxID=458696 RepID=A0A7J7DJD9_TRIWF|nr:hypothetical protein HS088_TW06G00589 [Tripterygium wilfordii]